jgi:hypothetical protein
VQEGLTKLCREKDKKIDSLEDMVRTEGREKEGEET